MLTVGKPQVGVRTRSEDTIRDKAIQDKHALDAALSSRFVDRSEGVFTCEELTERRRRVFISP